MNELPPIRTFFTPKALRTMFRYRQLGDEPESGGILLGTYYPSEGRMVVFLATKPGPTDRRTRHSFKRDAVYAHVHKVTRGQAARAIEISLPGKGSRKWLLLSVVLTVLHLPLSVMLFAHWLAGALRGRSPNPGLAHQDR